MASQRKRIFADGLFQDQCAIITGGGSGIGAELALLIGELGAKVAICGRRLDPLVETSKNLQSRGIKVFYATCDIRDEDSVHTFVSNVLKEFGRIDILVNNAGGQFPILAENLNLKGFTAVVRNNLIGTFNVTSTVAKLAFIPQNKGTIVNIIAQIARGMPGMVHTGAARAGVENMTKTLAIEWAKYNIRVNAIAPGVIVSSGTDRYPVEFLESTKNSTPIRRYGTCEEVAYLIAYLASEHTAGFITGQTYYIDGGHNIFGDSFLLKAAHPVLQGRPSQSKL